MEINKVFLSLGSNIGDRVHNLSLARIVISNKIGNITINSKIYQSEPWGFELQDSFLNQIIIIETYLGSKEVLKKILNIEKKTNKKILILDLLNLKFRKVEFNKKKNCICKKY